MLRAALQEQLQEWRQRSDAKGLKAFNQQVLENSRNEGSVQGRGSPGNRRSQRKHLTLRWQSACVSEMTSTH